MDIKFDSIDNITDIVNTIVMGLKNRSPMTFSDILIKDIALLKFESIIPPNTNPNTIGATE